MVLLGLGGTSEVGRKWPKLKVTEEHEKRVPLNPSFAASRL